MWYYSFDPFKTGADEFMVSQGGMINQPAVCKDVEDEFCTGGVDAFYYIQVDGRGFEYYLTEISRRFALTTNSVKAAVDFGKRPVSHADLQAGHHQPGRSGGYLRSRCACDDTDFDPAVDNPYAFDNAGLRRRGFTDATDSIPIIRRVCA